MILTPETIHRYLVLASIPGICSILFFLFTKRHKISLALLGLSGFLLRTIMIRVDPFLQDWDERFHALVAKNMMEFPFYPMLRENPILPYDPGAWCCNHIWVHKQPLFLWQMAISMKIFGVSEISIRIPSIIMGTLSIFMIYEIAKYWTKNINIAYLAALLFCFSFYQLELSSGRFQLGQNDITFAFYVTTSIWAFIRYIKNEYSLVWVLLIGLFIGCAVLTKWLVGLLVFGAWGLFVLLNKDLRTDKTQYLKIALGFLVSIAIFLPWQLYIMKAFPLESSIMYEHNKRHIFEVLEKHTGDILYHFEQMKTSFGKYLFPFGLLGILGIFFQKRIKKSLSFSLLAMIVVVVSFFSFVVPTKMPAFTNPVNALVWITIASGIVMTIDFVFEKIKTKLTDIDKWKKFVFLGLFIFLAFSSLRLKKITNFRKDWNTFRNIKISNTDIYKNLHQKNLGDRVIFNCKGLEQVELMFYQDVNAYTWYPKKNVLDSLSNENYQFAAFKSHTIQILPDYILNDSEIVIIDELLK